MAISAALPLKGARSAGGKRGNYQNCSVLYCVLKLNTIISRLRWAVLTVLSSLDWVLSHWAHSLCVDWFICVYLCILCVFVSYCICVVLL